MWSLAHLDPFDIGWHLAQYMFCLWGSKDNDQLLSWITTTSQKVVLFFDGCWEQYTNYKNFMIYCLHKHDYGLDAERIFCNGTWKRSLQRPMNTQILDYQVMPNVFEEDMIKIKFFGIIKETMDEVRESLEERFSSGNTVLGAWSSHHFITLSSSKFAHKLSSEDESHADTHHFNLPTTFQLCDIRPTTYLTCIYDSFWWVDLVTQVDVEQGDIKVQLMFPLGPQKRFNWPEAEDSLYGPIKNIFCHISSPTTTTGRPYKITNEEYDKAIFACQYLNMTK